MSESTNVFNAVIGGALINIGRFVQFFGQLFAAIATGNFDELNESLKRFIMTIKEFVRVASGSALLADFFERIDITGNIARAQTATPSAPGSASNAMAVELTVIDGAGLTEAVDIRIDGALDTQARQAQGELGNNE